MLMADPVASCMVASRIENLGMDPWRLGGELWGCEPRGFRAGRLDSLCFAGSNLIPLQGNRSALRAFADRALRRRRMCSSVVGPAEQVMGLWSELELDWGPAREVRDDQPLMSTGKAPTIAPDPLVQLVRAHFPGRAPVQLELLPHAQHLLGRPDHRRARPPPAQRPVGERPQRGSVALQR